VVCSIPIITIITLGQFLKSCTQCTDFSLSFVPLRSSGMEVNMFNVYSGILKMTESFQDDGKDIVIKYLLDADYN